jgi:hypothetical protein
MMISRRPGTLISCVRSAVGLLLTLSSFLVWGTAFASSAESTSASGDTAFDEDVVLLPAAEKTAALARDLDLRVDAVALQRHRSLQYTETVHPGDTTSAPLSAGNNNTECGGLTDCINGCHSHFYKVTGATTGSSLYAYTCYYVNFAQRLYIWKGSSSDCSTFTCTGTRTA